MRRSMLKNGVNALKLKIGVRSSPTHLSYSSYTDRVKRFAKIKSSETLPLSMYENGSFILFNNSQILIRKLDGSLELSWKSYADLQKFKFNILKNAVLLDFEEQPRYAMDTTLTNFGKEDFTEYEKFINFRTALLTLSVNDAVVTSKGLSLLKWNEEMKYCSFCATKLISIAGGIQRKCTSCKKVFYPPVSPVGITLVTDSNWNKVILVRQPTHPVGMYTCIAGFIEPGESIEENVKREVAEEIGLEIKRIKYYGSQHWAYPTSSLMIGCLAETEQENISVDHDELEDARWFTANEVEAAYHTILTKKQALTQPGTLWIPPQGAIAHDLVKIWLQERKHNIDVHV